MLVFLCSPISHSSYNQLHLPVFPILPALLGCHSKSGQVWPHGTEPIFSKLSHRLCNQGELLPSYILWGSHSQLPGSKHGHSYLTYLWNQLKVIDMLNDYARGYLHSCCYIKQLWMALLHVSLPQLRLVGWGHPIYIFSNISWTPWVLDPIKNPYLGPSSWLHPVTLGSHMFRETLYVPM